MTVSPPVFGHTSYRFSVTRGADDPGTVIGRVLATDNEGEVSYYIGGAPNEFDIDKKTGVITLGRNWIARGGARRSCG